MGREFTLTLVELPLENTEIARMISITSSSESDGTDYEGNSTGMLSARTPHPILRTFVITVELALHCYA